MISTGSTRAKRLWLPVTAFALWAAAAGAVVSTNGAGHTMEQRITAGGGAAFSGTYEMVTVSAGPVAPGGSDGAGFDAYALSPETFALPTVLSRFSVE